MVIALATVLVLLLIDGGEGFEICNIDSSQLNLCRVAVTGPNPPPPDQKCCEVIRQANLPCLCQYKSLLPSIGIDPKNAFALPPKCGINNPPQC
ncbi:hypothetical protein RJT34_10826 [Clitoria ternatea]